MFTIEKELSDIAWNVPENIYRTDSALSYSTIAKYEREGFNSLSHLFDKVESPSLTFGSCVDTMLTGGEEEFHKAFQVLDINLTESGVEITKQLISKVKQGFLHAESFADIPEQTVSQTAKETGFWKADKWDKIRYTQVLKTGNIADYFQALLLADKMIINVPTYEAAKACVRSLRESPTTCGYFATDDEFSPIRRYYQLKFKATIKNVNYRSMADLIIVDYEDKKIIPCDLKTSGSKEWDFQHSFCKWNYMQQARLYWLLIRLTLDKDPYFKDFSLENYRFIVINKDSLTPLVWEFPLTRASGTLIDDEGHEYRDPLELGAELRSYLDNKPPVPKGIDLTGLNTITCLHRKDNA